MTTEQSQPDQISQAPVKTTVDTRSLSGKTAAFPHLPGVYLFKDAGGEVLYAGKARDLRKRVMSYFQRLDAGSVKTRMLLGKAADLEYIVTPTEKEALLLEASLIKKHRPRYNVVLRDDKNYPALRIDLNEPFPRIEVVRRFQKDGALYFGPYPSASAVRQTLKLLNQIFPLRQCKGRRLVTRERPCLNYSMGQCLGACAGKIGQDEYRRMVDEVILFLQGKTDTLQKQLTGCMEEAAANLEFERAAYYRDRLRAISLTLEKQHIVSDRFLNQDVLGIFQEPEGSELVVIFVRQGVIAGQKDFDLGDAHGEKDELIAAFIQQYYGETRYIPDEVLTPVPLEVGSILEEWLTELKGRRVRIWPARRGDRKYLLDIADDNARERFNSRRKWRQKEANLLDGLQQVLRLPRLPKRMACVDISNIQGQHAVGAVVVFADGLPDKNSYRRFRVKSKSEPDDPAMMAEVVERFLSGEKELAAGLDLLVLDGGKSQLNRIMQVVKNAGMIDRLPVISIAKEREDDRGERGRGLYEKFYKPGRRNPVFLASHPDILHLLQRLRDEAHRFAVTHYKKLHRKELLSSTLDNIPGVGPKRRQLLIKHFGSLEALRLASLEEIRNAPGISNALAEAIKKGLGTDGNNDGQR
jgi:excinuclease ABC subunit C